MGIVGPTPAFGSQKNLIWYNFVVMQSVYQRQTNRRGSHKTLSYFILFVILIIFLSTVGVRLLINTSIFISHQLSDRKVEDNRHTDELVGNPEIIDVPSSTDSASIDVEIINVKNKNVTLTVNEVIQETMFSDENSISSTVQLERGDNDIVVEAEDTKSKEIKTSKIYKVTYIQELPELEITNPTEGMVTGKEEMMVTGHVKEDITVKVNGSPVVVSGEGSFSSLIKLVNGENKIVVVAQNRAGATEEKTITVRYEP